MLEFFLDLPPVLQVLTTFVVLTILILIITAIAASKQISRGNLASEGDFIADKLVPGTFEDFDDDENEDDEDYIELIVGQSYEISDCPSQTQIVVKEVDDDYEEIYGDLIITLPAGAKFESLQRFYSDDYEEIVYDSFVIVYLLDGVYKTLTWDGELFINDYVVIPVEIVIREFSVPA